MPTKFRKIFDRQDDHKGERTKFLSRLFGIFSERIVAVRAKDERAAYENLGRPTIRTQGLAKGHTLDFTLRSRATGKIYAAEMKCEIEYMSFRYFILEASAQLDHHKKPAFAAFLEATRQPEEQIVRVQGRQLKIDGTILVWGAIGTEARNSVIAERGFYDIISIEDISAELAQWRNPEYLEMIERYRGWANRLFDGLASGENAI